MRNSPYGFFIFASYLYKFAFFVLQNKFVFKMPVVLRLLRLLRLIYERCKARQLSPN